MDTGNSCQTSRIDRQWYCDHDVAVPYSGSCDNLCWCLIALVISCKHVSFPTELNKPVSCGGLDNPSFIPTTKTPHHVAQHHPIGSETTPPYAPRSSRFGSEPPSVEDDVDVWRYAILELHARNDDDDAQRMQTSAKTSTDSDSEFESRLIWIWMSARSVQQCRGCIILLASVT